MAVLRRGQAGPPAVRAVIAAVVLTSCTSSPGPNEQPADATGTGCTVTVDTPDEVRRVLAETVPGWLVCVTGDLGDTDLVLESSGRADRPIRLVADDAVVRSIVVTADHVVVDGFVVLDGDGIVLTGRDLVVRDNEVRGAALDGISCEDRCADVTIEGNSVVEADGSGILVEGARIAVRGNSVSGSVRRESGDADGIRFFGTAVQIVGNTVSDITDDGYDGDPPHTDCFQTYDNSRPPTVGAVITDNVCRDVDHQCLIATAEEAGLSGQVGRSRGIEFTDNVCDVGGAQAVLVQWFPDVDVRGNTFAGPGLDRAAIFLDGSTDGAFLDNTVPDAVVPHELDESSGSGFATDRPR